MLKLLGVKLENRRGDDSDFVYFRLSEVNYIYMVKPTNNSARVPAYHTARGTFLALNTIKDVSLAYKQFGFESYGRSNVINEERVCAKVPMREGTLIKFKDGSSVMVRKKVF